MTPSKRILSGLALLALLTVLQVVALSRLRADDQELRRIFAQVASPDLPASEQAIRIVEFLKQRPDAENQRYCLLPIFSFLRATPLQVAEGGGDCADRSRLLVVMLHFRGIPASKWALYSAAGHPKHAVVEAMVESGPMALDTLFGLWFPRPEGGYYGIRDLKADSEILRSRVLDLRARNERLGADKVSDYPLDDYTYTHARTINWDKSILMKSAYRILRAIMGGKADNVPRPFVSEQPALVIFWATTATEIGFVSLWAFVRLVYRRRAKRPAPGIPLRIPR